MSLEKAKEKLQENQKEKDTIEALINPPKITKPKIKIPPQKDIRLIEQILRDKLESKKRKITEEYVENINHKYEKEIKEIHQKAINLRIEAETFAKKIELENNNNIKARFLGNNYEGGYLKDLPEDIKEATNHDFFELTEEPGQIKAIQTEIDEFLLNIKIGDQPLADVKPLIAKIELM